MKNLITVLLVATVAVCLLSVRTVGINNTREFWARVINSPSRFEILSDFSGEAVLDNETGLVWQRTPVPGEGEPIEAPRRDAFITCAEKTIGTRKGWRLPKVEELASLVDSTQQPPSLPPNHPFTDVNPTGLYWTASTVSTGEGLLVTFNMSQAPIDLQNVDNPNLYWCVRGGGGHDGGQ
jgi:hypothetical protein